MRIQCAWCKIDMGTKRPYGDDRVSHSCCHSCKRLLRESILKQQGVLDIYDTDATGGHGLKQKAD